YLFASKRCTEPTNPVCRYDSMQRSAQKSGLVASSKTTDRGTIFAKASMSGYFTGFAGVAHARWGQTAHIRGLLAGSIDAQ
ncbi:MAG: hypothetical protein WA888_16995, partial [Burkholderiaceae bacterium]